MPEPPANPLDHAPLAVIDPRNAAPVGNVKPSKKEQDAGYIAKIIVWTFTGAVAALILLVYLVVLKYPWIDDTNPAAGAAGQHFVYRAVELLTLAAAPTLKEFGAFLSTVFGSLLAFILGYYFGEQKKES